MIKKSDLKSLKNKYLVNKDNEILQRLVRSTELTNLICDKDTYLDVKFNYEIKTHGITNQNNSGRCWIFGGLNILREKVIKNCNLNNFELSASYISFYDKLERFNFIEDRLISLLKEGKNIYDKDINSILKIGIEDGGYYRGFSDLVKKYGVVPSDVYPETYQSSNTSEINQILTRLLKKFYIEVELNLNRCEKIKNKYLEYVYNILSTLYGTPVEKFNFEYIDKNNIYHIDKNITPKKFFEKYIKVNLDNYVEIYSYQDNLYKYNTLYQIKDSSKIVGYKDYVILNASHEVMKNLLLRQIKNGEYVYFSTSTPDKMISGIWIDTFERYGEIFGIDLTLSNNDILKTNETSGEHVMIFTGVSIIDNKPIKWKVENSWGEKEGNNGYYVATDDWVNKYVYNIIVNKKYLTKSQLSILNNKPIIINSKYSKF